MQFWARITSMCGKKSRLNFMSSVGFQVSKVWMFFLENLLWRNFSSHFQAEVIPQSPLFLDFRTDFHFHMIENLDQLDFGLIGVKKCQQIFTNIFFSFLSHHYGFTNYFEMLSFLLCNIIPGGVSTCFNQCYSRNIKH